MSMDHTLVVSLHDFHPGSRVAIAAQREALHAWGVDRCSILVVPEFHHGLPTETDTPSCEALRQWQAAGDELVLHGYYHDRRGLAESWRDLFWTRLYTNQEAEFWNLSPEEAQHRLSAGLEIFQRNRWRASGFIAPAWLLPKNLWPIVARQGFHYTTLLTGIVRWHGSTSEPTVEPTQSLVYSTRAAWRRSTSLAWNAWLARQLQTQNKNCIRLSLHPRDLEFPEIAQQIEQLVRRLVGAGWIPATYAEYVARSPR